MKDYELKGSLETIIDDILLDIDGSQGESQYTVYSLMYSLRHNADKLEKVLRELSGLKLIERFEKRLKK